MPPRVRGAGQIRSDVDDELRFHLESRTEEPVSCRDTIRGGEVGVGRPRQRGLTGEPLLLHLRSPPADNTPSWGGFEDRADASLPSTTCVEVPDRRVPVAAQAPAVCHQEPALGDWTMIAVAHIARKSQ